MGWTEKFNFLAVPSLIFTWEERNLNTLYGVPKNAVVLLALINEETDSDNSVNAREKGTLDSVGGQLQKAGPGGGMVFTAFCNTDADGIIEIYQGDLANTRIALIGYLIGCTYTYKVAYEEGPDDDTWRVVGDAAYANRVVCIRLTNSDEENELLAGAREIDSILERKFAVMERELAGTAVLGDILVQADESGNFEAYRQDGAGCHVQARGYFSLNVSFTEAMVDEDVGDQVPWGDETISAPASSLAQFLITNNYPVDEKWGGIRQNGSALTRRFDLAEAEGMGLVGFGDLVNVDGSQIIENYVEAGALIDIHYLGHLTITPPPPWPHKFLGIANANIAKIMGIPKANIEKVMGVA